MQKNLRRVVIYSLAHFVVAMLIAIMAFGTDMDQLRSRTPLSRAAAHVHDVLWWPHDRALRAFPGDWVAHNAWIIPVAVVLNSLLWGAALYGITARTLR